MVKTVRPASNRTHRIKLREAVVKLGKPERVDRENGVIYGVKVLGPESANRRRYTLEAIRAAVSLYEGAPVNADHPTKPDDSRSVHDCFAWLEHVRVDRDGGLRGDLHLLDPGSPLSVKLMTAAEQRHDLFGLSHNATGQGYTDQDGTFVCEVIESLTSVDLVTDPATTRGLFERRTMKLTLRQLLEAASKKIPARRKRAANGLRKLLEDYGEEGDKGDVALMDDEMDMAPEAPAGKDWKQCLIDAIAELHKSDDPEAHDMAGKLHKLLKPEAPMEEAEGDSPEAGSEKEPEDKEQEDDLEESGSDEIRGKNQDGQKRAMFAKSDNPYEESRKNRRKLSPTARALQERIDKLEADKREAELKTWLREACETRKLTWTVALQEAVLPLKDRKAIGRVLDQMKTVAASQGRGLPRSQGQPAQRTLVEGLEKAPTTAKEFADGLHQLAGSRW